MRRLRNAISQAHAAASHANRTLSLADALIEELADGVKLKLVRVGDSTILDFLQGRVDELPIAIQLDIEE